ncbi:MAG: hypothetical protein H6736_02525 [Alphaproteobacteria bacterium]|nr:hypothetical protein [Alphaproteobacteria bacterium]MCB9690667.1 hypothetical protein [Alphaproteobacteria bacterium]
MSKSATIASLVRTASRSEAEFHATIEEVFAEGDLSRVADFFDKLNIPRSTGAEDGLFKDVPVPSGSALTIGTFEEEHAISSGIQRYLDRHERKIKWHATHPGTEGIPNVLLLFREAMFVTNLRLKRLEILLDAADELTPAQWAVSREMMNRSYLSFRNFLQITAHDWVDALVSTMSPDEIADQLRNPSPGGGAVDDFYQLVDHQIRELEEARERLEARRMELTVVPEGFPPVKPPNYFGGDLMGRGPWKQFWNHLNAAAHHFRESVA